MANKLSKEGEIRHRVQKPPNVCNDRAERKLGLEGKARKWFTSHYLLRTAFLSSCWNNITSQDFFRATALLSWKIELQRENFRGEIGEMLESWNKLVLSHLSPLSESSGRFNRRRRIIPSDRRGALFSEERASERVFWALRQKRDMNFVVNNSRRAVTPELQTGCSHNFSNCCVKSEGANRTRGRTLFTCGESCECYFGVCQQQHPTKPVREHRAVVGHLECISRCNFRGTRDKGTKSSRIIQLRPLKSRLLSSPAITVERESWLAMIISDFVEFQRRLGIRRLLLRASLKNSHFRLFPLSSRNMSPAFRTMRTRNAKQPITIRNRTFHTCERPSSLSLPRSIRPLHYYHWFYAEMWESPRT